MKVANLLKLDWPTKNKFDYQFSNQEELRKDSMIIEAKDGGRTREEDIDR